MLNVIRPLVKIGAVVASLACATGLNAETVSTRFNLFCEGVRESGGASKPFTTELRIDLAARKWCDDECKDVRSFAKIERDRLTLSENETSSFEEWTYVERTTGEFVQVFRSPLLRSTTKAECSRRPYKAIVYQPRKF